MTNQPRYSHSRSPRGWDGYPAPRYSLPRRRSRSHSSTHRDIAFRRRSRGRRETGRCTASGSVFIRMNAARPMAGAVLRPTGSARICFWAESRKLAHDLAPQMFVRDDPETRRRSQRQQPRHGLLNHGLLAVERQQLLGPALPAQRPEAGAAAAGKNHGMEICLCHSI